MTATQDHDAGERLRALGWHQGALVEIPCASLANEKVDPQRAIVASQDCDIVALTSIERDVDLLPVVLKDEPEPDLLFGKNPRQLCVALDDGRYGTIDVRRRLTLAKESLSTIPPLAQSSVSEKDRKVLAKWLAKRYSRPAFPDAFNERLASQRRKLERLSKRDESKTLTAVFMMLDTEEELDSSRDYKVVLWFACRRPDVQIPEQRATLEKYAGDLVAAFESCEGIRVIEFELRTHDEITLADLELMKRFDWDFRSQAQKPGGTTAPEE